MWAFACFINKRPASSSSPFPVLKSPDVCVLDAACMSVQVFLEDLNVSSGCSSVHECCLKVWWWGRFLRSMTQPRFFTLSPHRSDAAWPGHLELLLAALSCTILILKTLTSLLYFGLHFSIFSPFFFFLQMTTQLDPCKYFTRCLSSAVDNVAPLKSTALDELL